MKKQIIFIHGGDTFETYDEYVKFLREFELDETRIRRKRWSEKLEEKLGGTFEVITPRMPNRENAKYAEWKIWFDKHVPLFNPEVVLVGHSLGGTFLAKYLSENVLPKKIKGVFLVAPPFDDKDADYTLADFILPPILRKLEEQCGTVYLYHSKDDPVVPFADHSKYQAALPKAQVSVFTDRGHFSREEFPELIRDIQTIW